MVRSSRDMPRPPSAPTRPGSKVRQMEHHRGTFATSEGTSGRRVRCEPWHHTRPIAVTLDPSAHQELLLARYCGPTGSRTTGRSAGPREPVTGCSERDADARRAAGTCGVWSAYSLTKAVNATRESVARGFGARVRSGTVATAQALENWSKSSHGSHPAPRRVPRSRSATGRSTDLVRGAESSAAVTAPGPTPLLTGRQRDSCSRSHPHASSPGLDAVSSGGSTPLRPPAGRPDIVATGPATATARRPRRR